MRACITIFLLAGLLLLSQSRGVFAAASLTGVSGLIEIPTAQVVEDGAIFLGASYLQKDYIHQDKKIYTIYPAWVTVGYLPNFELSIRFTAVPDARGQAEGIGYYKDGMASVQLRLFRGSRYMPAVAVGVQDVYGFMLFNALYAVSSKEVRFGSFSGKVHFGLATDVMDKHQGTTKADRENYPVLHRLVSHPIKVGRHRIGVFGGVDANIGRDVLLMAEYDTRGINIGARATFFSHVTPEIALLNFERIGAGINLSFHLL